MPSSKSNKRPFQGGLDKFFIARVVQEDACDTDTSEAPLEEPASKRSKTRMSGFNPEWKVEYPWVRELDNGMKCSLCIKYGRRPTKVAVGKASWVDVPCHTMTKASLTKHARSACHTESKAFDRASATEMTIEQGIATLTSTNKMARVAAFRSLYWLAKRELPHTTNYLPLVELCKLQGVNILNNLDHGGNDNGQSMRFMKEAMLTMGKAVQTPIINGVKASPFYAILIDETTDIQTIKEMVVYIRYLKDGQSTTHFLRMVPLNDGRAESIVTAIFALLSELDLSPQRMCALGSDGASVMLGSKNGVAAKLREKIPHLISNHCVAHRLALAVSQSTKHISYLKTFKDVMDQLFRFYRNSPVRMAALHEIQAIVDDPVLKLTQAKDVRWLSHDAATRTLSKCLPSVITSLEREAQERNDTQAMGLSVFLQQYKFIASLLMMRDVLPHLSALSKAMQARDAVYTTVGPMVNGTVSILKALKTTPGEHFLSVEEIVGKLDTEGFTIKGNTESLIKQFKETVYKPFIDALISNLEGRFPDIRLIQNYSVFDASVFPEEAVLLQEHGNAEVKELAQHFNLDPVATVEEWKQVKATLQQSPTHKDAKPDKVMEYVALLESSHPCMYKLAVTGLLLPTSTADCERGFSTLKRVKTTHRNSLSMDVLNCLLTVSMDGPPVQEFDFEGCVENWHKQKPRRSSL